jgi:dTDP-4-amino-4,6-dideoxygalactose transaminase
MTGRKKLNMTDDIPFGKPLIGEEERQAVMQVLEGSVLVHGSRSLEFERSFAEFTQAPYAVSISSCTAGMHLVYFALGLGEGDEVIVPAQTHVATAHAVELTGAKAVFVDSEETTGNIDATAIEAAITPRTKAIAVVHYLGVPVDMSRVVQIARRNNLFVLEDCALALGAKVDGIHVGLLGNAGVFSFYPVKHITTAEGGMIIVKDKTLAQRLHLLKAFGVDRNYGERKVPGIYDTVALGFNYRMSEIHAAIGVEQLKKLPRFLEQRAKNFSVLASALDDIPRLRVLPQPIDSHLHSSHYCLGVILDEPLASKRSNIIARLKMEGVGCSVYYPHPVPCMSYYRQKYAYCEMSYPKASKISNSLIALPVGPHLQTDQMLAIADKLRSVLSEIEIY